MSKNAPQRFAVDCPSRILFDQIADKWSMMVLTVLDSGPLRFNEIKRRLEGVSQKALTECLRRLERNGLLTRHVLPTSPVSVEYEISALGRKLQRPFKALYAWTVEYLNEVENARHAYDLAQSTISNSKGVYRSAIHR
ncbi:winged helix-turn-helix transcriptional regulator [Paraburkholderia dinghuensis]|uniref:Transcriptional regulator n=1 Tax=Paraburkholderia dinghuensis TaxID=2305225 RepID=A0A3N6Q0C7_9BURK|nr:helix-turn-helix domain-containing protein [Paraburkholderia dinghuensis]RQH08320.1 transcriptional regulator [Paraburkholderia dinghuensis]